MRAAAVLADRADDSTTVPDTYRPLTTPGTWIPTTPPITAQYARANPWRFERSEQFRPGPPPALASAEYARDYNETKNLGGTRSTQRTPSRRRRSSSRAESRLGLASSGASARNRSRSNLRIAHANSFIVD